MRPTIAIRCTIKSIIDFHCSRLEHPSQGGDIIASRTAAGKKGNRWVVVATFLTPPLNFDQSDHTRPPLRHYGSIFISCFGYDAAISGEMIRRHHRHGKTYSLLGGGGDIPHSPTQFLPNQSHRTIAKTSWIDL
jgi:hypothetical protein